MSDDKNLSKRAFIAYLPFMCIALLVLIKLVIIQFIEGPALRAETNRDVIKEVIIPADRGNIYSFDGKLLASSMPVYDVFMDPGTIKTEVFNEGISDLSIALAQKIGKRSASQWEKYITAKRKSGSRYLPLIEQISFGELQEIKSFPIFKLGRYKGGLIYEQENVRMMPLGKIAERTIGYDRLQAQTGIEGAYSSYLSGHEGLRLKQKVSNGNWKPLTDYYEVEPQDGLDLVTTIDSKMQDIAHHELLKALEKFEAHHGCVVVMEVATGKIKAIANLGRTEKGTYFEKRNYAVWESTEPGSTFKLASLMIALEDGVADTNTLVDTENGIYTIYNKKIKDSNYRDGKGGYGKITLKRAFELSSNVGTVKLIYDNYKDRPERFVDKLYSLGLQNRLDLPIKGEGKPNIPTPNSPNWSGISLPWMAFGYQVSFTPLQVLSFYNAIANEGSMVKPQFVSEIKQHGRTVEKIETEVINPAICSQETLGKLQSMLLGVVENGTATNIQNSVVSIAGKTGTCQQNYWKQNTHEYQASFCGYFPAENPKYSCIVVINKPNNHRGYYGSTVAAPVFKAIAKSTYLSTPKPLENKSDYVFAEVKKEFKLNGKVLPNLKGENGSEVISHLENLGFKVKAEGNGKVKWQYPKAGTSLNSNSIIELKLG